MVQPDLIFYFDNLFWRSAGTIGHNTMYLSENDIVPDDSVHWMD
jgi:predicted AlkP superfamily phosphohydrolase/phosphomutase